MQLKKTITRVCSGLFCLETDKELASGYALYGVRRKCLSMASPTMLALWEVHKERKLAVIKA